MMTTMENEPEEPKDYQVREVIDGDTFRIEGKWERRGRKGDIIRPYGYDTPEKGEPGYEETKQRLTDLILGKTVSVVYVRSMDHFGRLVARVEFEGKSLAEYFPGYKD
jgi:micrococcal nuclease